MLSAPKMLNLAYKYPNYRKQRLNHCLKPVSYEKSLYKVFVKEMYRKHTFMFVNLNCTSSYFAL